MAVPVRLGPHMLALRVLSKSEIDTAIESAETRCKATRNCRGRVEREAWRLAVMGRYLEDV